MQSSPTHNQSSHTINQSSIANKLPTQGPATHVGHRRWRSSRCCGWISTRRRHSPGSGREREQQQQPSWWSLHAPQTGCWWQWGSVSADSNWLHAVRDVAPGCCYPDAASLCECCCSVTCSLYIGLLDARADALSSGEVGSRGRRPTDIRRWPKKLAKVYTSCISPCPKEDLYNYLVSFLDGKKILFTIYMSIFCWQKRCNIQDLYNTNMSLVEEYSCSTRWPKETLYKIYKTRIFQWAGEILFRIDKHRWLREDIVYFIQNGI